jgi:hypothetical protein
VTDAQNAIEAALVEARRLRKVLGKDLRTQVRSDDQKQVARATAQTWFNVHRKTVVTVLGEDDIRAIDDQFKTLIAATNRATVRTKYLFTLKQIEKMLGQLQAEHVISLTGARPVSGAMLIGDIPPSFSPLISDTKMQAILANRWQECVKCVQAGAPLAATVMMGGILEGLLLARINQLTDKNVIFKAVAAPKDKSGKTLMLQEWGLKNFMDVAREVKWISQTGKDIGEVVRDYRNYIHPQKEYSHGIVLSSDDAKMLWEVAKAVMIQVLRP